VELGLVVLFPGISQVFHLRDNETKQNIESSI